MKADDVVTHNFYENMKSGDEFEIFSIDDIRKKKYKTAHKFLSKDKARLKFYDIVITDENDIVNERQRILFGIECKNDAEAFKTGNLFIEVGQWDYNDVFSESGLYVTKSKYWLHTDGEITYLFETDVIREIIRLFDEYTVKFNKIIRNISLEGYEIDELLRELNGEYMVSIKGFNPMSDNIKFVDKKEIFQQGDYWKPMRYYLIKKELMSLYCIEKADKDKMTYEKMI